MQQQQMILVGAKERDIESLRVSSAQILPTFLPSKPLIKQRKHLRDIELDVFKIEIFLVIFLHLKEIVELEIEF